MKKALLACTLILSLAGGSLAAEVRWGGRWAGGLSGDARDEGRWTARWQQLELDLEYRSDELKLYTSSTFLLDMEKVEPTVNWGECYLDYRSNLGRWTVGRQIVHWGQSLALPVMDVISPSDYSRLFQGYPEAENLPQWGLRWRKDLNSLQLEGLYLAEFRPARLPENALPEAAPPESGLLKGEWGGRLRIFLPVGDLGLAAFYGYDDQPVYRSSVLLIDGSPELALSGSYEPYWLLGWDAALPAGPLLIRLENSLSLWKSFTRQTPGTEPFYAHQISGLLGIDWMPSDWGMVLEAMGSYRMQDEDDALDDPLTLQCVADLSRSFAAGRWEAGCSALWDVLEEQLYLNPQLSHIPADGLVLEGGAELLWGESGLSDEEQRILYLRMEYVF